MPNRRLANWLDSYLEFTNNSESPELFHIWTALSVLAGALQRKCKLPLGLLTIFPNLYVVLVSPPGEARKGTALDVGWQLLDDIGVKMAAEATTRESLIRELKNCNDTIVHIDGKTDFHASLTIFSQELTVFLGYQNRQLISDLTDWYDCRKRWTYRTKNMGTDDIIGVWVNLIGATTPELIQASMPLETIGSGLSSRIIFVYEQKKRKSVPITFLTDREVELKKYLAQDLEQIHMLQGDFKMTDKFLNMWVDWYTKHEEYPPFKDFNFRGYISRRPTHIRKLCMLLNVARTNSMILDEQDFTRALNIIDRTEIKMPYTFSGVGKLDTADIVSRVMTEIGVQKKCSFPHLMGLFYKDVDKITLQRIIESLESMNFIKFELDNGVQTLVYQKDSKYAQDLDL